MCLPRLVIPDLLWAKIPFCCHLDTKRALGIGTGPLPVPTVPGCHLGTHQGCLRMPVFSSV